MAQVEIPAVLLETRTMSWARLEYRYEHVVPRDDEIAAVRVACFHGDSIVIPFEGAGLPMLFPGGGLEPGETLDAAVTRELLEEVGARPDAFHPFGVVRLHSHEDGPGRPNTPHPDFSWIVGWADVEIVGPPTSPDGAEQIDRVEIFPSVDAIPTNGRASWDWWSALLALAVEMRAAHRGA